MEVVIVTQMLSCRWAAKLAGALGAACSGPDRHLPVAAVPAKDCDGASASGCQGGGPPGVP